MNVDNKIINPHEGAKILIVEDSPIQRELLKRTLVKNGYEVILAEDGEQGLLSIKNNLPSIVISDITMPYKNGYEMCKEMKQSPLYSNIPVILLSQLSDPREIIHGLVAEADNYITKPYSEEFLISKINQLLSNTDHRESDLTKDISINFSGDHYTISSNRQQILNLLLSTYESAVIQNQELSSTQLELKTTNEQLTREIEEHQRMEKELRNHRDLLEEIVRARTDELRKHRDLLEEMVVTRTQELISANEQLQKEITLHKETETLLHLAKDAAESGNRAKSEFLANMSHEIRTPMNAIIGMVELVLESELSNEQRELIEIVSHSADALLALLNSILDFSKIEAGKMSLEAIEFNILSLVEGIMDTMAPQAHKKHLELLYDIHQDVPMTLIGDPERLRQIIINLIGNAIKFTHRGEIVVSVNDDTSRADFKKYLAELVFTVSDTGIGIPKDKTKTIFEAFKQADGSTTREYGGTGLGLSITSKLIALMGGEISVESEPGHGSVFNFKIKFQTPKPNHLDQVELDLERMPILILDDNLTGRKILKEALLQWNALVSESDDGISGLSCIKKERENNTPFQVIFIDSRMPGLTGQELVKRIKEDVGGNEKMVMMFYTNYRKGDLDTVNNMGLSGYLMKPIKRAQLLSLMALLSGKTINDSITKTSDINKTITSKNIAPQLHILIAEDNENNQKLAQRILQGASHTSRIAKNGKLALDFLKEEHFDLILMDIQMPEMDGIETTRIIRNSDSLYFNNSIPIIAVTAHALRGDMERFLDAGMNDYISKPFKAEVLHSTIERVMSKKAKSTADIQNNKMVDVESKTTDIVKPEIKVPIKELTKEITDDFKEHFELLRHSLNDGDKALIEQYALSLRDLLSRTGLSEVSELAFRAVLAVRKGDIEKVKNMIALVSEKIDELIYNINKGDKNEDTNRR